MNWFDALFPKSLVTRVYALYAATLLLIVSGGLGIFYQFQFTQHIVEAQDASAVLVEVMAQTIADSAVIGETAFSLVLLDSHSPSPF